MLSRHAPSRTCSAKILTSSHPHPCSITSPHTHRSTHTISSTFRPSAPSPSHQGATLKRLGHQHSTRIFSTKSQPRSKNTQNLTEIHPFASKRVMTENRSSYLLECDTRSIQHGIQLLFGDWDQDIIVVNKPYGLPMTANHRDNITTRVKQVLQKDQIFPVHRLDKYTSGCLVIALNQKTATALQSSLQSHTLASVKTTQGNLRHKHNTGAIRQHIKNQLINDESEVGPMTHKDKGKRIDNQWSKRYRVLCQMPPCTAESIHEFMRQQRILARILHTDSKFKSDTVDLSSEYKYYLDHFAENAEKYSRLDPKEQQMLQSAWQPRHSPHVVASPHQHGSVFPTPDQFSSDLQLLAPPLKSIGHLHSHLLHRDFLPNDWIDQHHVLHMKQLNAALIQKDSPVDAIPLDDIRVPFTKAHTAVLDVPLQDDPILGDQQHSPSYQTLSTANSCDDAAMDALSSFSSTSLRNIRDSVQYRLLHPGAPRPPDNEDEDAQDSHEIDKDTAYSGPQLQKQLAAHKICPSANTAERDDSDDGKAPLYISAFSRLINADGIAVAPFEWINARIQLLEQVLKMTVMGKLNPYAVKLIYRRLSKGDRSIVPHFQVVDATPKDMKVKGKMTFIDSVSDDLEQASEPKTKIHSADIAFSDDILVNPKDRWHPFHWVAHRVVLNKLGQTFLSGLIDYKGKPRKHTAKTTHKHNSTDTKLSKSALDKSAAGPDEQPPSSASMAPAFFPLELPCGCLLPYVGLRTTATDPLSNPAGSTDDIPSQSPEFRHTCDSRLSRLDDPQNIHLSKHLPPSPPHPFIPPAYLYESVPAQYGRHKFLPNRNVFAVPKAVPTAIQNQMADDPDLKQTIYDFNTHGNYATGLVCSELKPLQNDDGHSSDSGLSDDENADLSVSQSLSTTLDYGKLKETTEQLYVAVTKATAKEATTLFTLSYMNPSNNVVMYHAKLLSGRTHQLRIHFSDIGLPIKGDPYYNPYYVKHWLSTYLHSYYHRHMYESDIRSLAVRSLFGHCEGGITGQLYAVDNWRSTVQLDPRHTNRIITDTYRTEALLEQQESSQDSIARELLHIEKSKYQHVPLRSSLANPSGDDQQDGNGDEHDNKCEDVDLDERFFDTLSQAALTPIETEMFLQSYMIEFPLPEGIRKTRSMARREKSERLGNTIEATLAQQRPQEVREEGVDPDDAVLLDAIRLQTSQKQPGTRIRSRDRINPVLSDGLPLYHSRKSKEEIAEARQRKRELKNTQRKQREMYDGLVSTMLAGQTEGGVQLSVPGHVPNKPAGENPHDLHPDGTAVKSTHFDDFSSSFDKLAADYSTSPDDLDIYVDNPELSHPEGFVDIQRLFSSEDSPLHQALRDPFNQSISQVARPLCTSTHAMSDLLHPDQSQQVQFGQQTLSIPLSVLWHLNTPFKSWAFTNGDGIEMVRVVLGVPQSWSHAM